MATKSNKNHIKILFINHTRECPDEYFEFASSLKAKAFFAGSTEESIHALNNNKIDRVILEISNVNDVGIIKYINDYFPEIKVIIVATEAFDDVISVFNKARYSVVHEPFQFSELRDEIAKNKQFTE